jgi:ribosome-binding factor A
MKPYGRADRVGEQVLKEISQLLLQGLKDPRLDDVVVTGVRMTRDLRIARTYFSISGGPDRIQQALEGFRSAKGFIKRELAGRLGLRYMPDLQFFYDESFDYGERIERILKNIKAENGFDRSTSAEKPKNSDRRSR